MDDIISRHTEELEQKWQKVYIGMIARDTIYTETILGLQSARLLDRLHINRKGSPDNARNCVVRDFLKTDSTHLLFIDSDVVVTPAISSLLNYSEPVIAPLSYTVLRNQVVPCVFKEASGGGITPDLAVLERNTPVLYEADVTGCCWMVAREVYENCADEDGLWHRQTWHNDDGVVQYGEDRYFFRLVRKAGYRLKIASRIKVGHMKTVRAMGRESWSNLTY